MADINVIVEAGKATAAAPLGPALGPLGVNIGAVVAEVNAKTKEFSGMKIPVTISVDAKTKSFEINVGAPGASALILKEAGVQKGAGNQSEFVGNLSLEQLKKVASAKFDTTTATTLKGAAKTICGTCKQMGITVDGRDPRAVIREIAEGKHDALFS